MGNKNKLAKFAESAVFPNMFQPDYEEVKDGYAMQGKWCSDFFKNKNDLVLELGCGKGEYTVGLGRNYPNRNFIGVDIKGARIWRGCKTSVDEGLNNVAFLRQKIQLISNMFTQDEVAEIWITFPDPQPKVAKRRLTSPQYMERYAKILKSGGIINFKTDSEPLFDYTLEMIEEYGHELIVSVKDLYSSESFEEVKSIRTHYEKLFNDQGFDINFMQFRLNSEFHQKHRQ
ncbi:MAG: tRNA (guanosine(46)-N7)-methyltransferase TrmB [Bacteroidales bacterium]|nr:tRNA (guanosine(46)-N7)-methyltransferase TrmB [Bacteroidales bacterium]